MITNMDELKAEAIGELIEYDDENFGLFITEEGLLIKTFGEGDEIWVLLDEDGDPIVDGERFTSKQVDEDEDNRPLAKISLYPYGARVVANF